MKYLLILALLFCGCAYEYTPIDDTDPDDWFLSVDDDRATMLYGGDLFVEHESFYHYIGDTVTYTGDDVLLWDTPDERTAQLVWWWCAFSSSGYGDPNPPPPGIKHGNVITVPSFGTCGYWCLGIQTCTTPWTWHDADGDGEGYFSAGKRTCTCD